MENEPNAQSPTVPDQAPVEQAPMPESKLNFFPLLLVTLISAAIFGLGGYYLGQRSMNIQPTPTPTVAATNTPSPTPDEKTQWLTYANENPKYMIQYPADWTVDSSRAEIGPDEDGELILTKGDYSLTISWPTAFGPGGCIFEDHAEYTTFNADPIPQFSLCSGPFKEFVGGKNTFRRLVAPRSDTPASVWTIYTKEVNSKYFVTVPPIAYSAPVRYDEDEIETMDAILKTFDAN